MIFLLVISLIGSSYRNNPFNYPHYTIEFDISGKKQPSYEDYIDEWIIDLYDCRKEIITDKFNETFEEWKQKSEQKLKHCILWRTRKREKLEALENEINQDSYDMFEFVFTRTQTRYHQRNYQKYPYTVKITDKILACSLRDLFEIDDELEEIEYKTTRKKWQSLNQRKLMTKELKEKIKVRDNYTCQICGKYMPDEVGLHIDHIIPIKKGGKSVESNLQVLCDKCNLSKGKK